MPSRNSKLYSLILILADIAFLMAAFTIAYIVRVQLDTRPLVNEIYAFEFFRTFVLIVPFWILVYASLGLYHPSTYNYRLREWAKIGIGSFVGILLVIGWQFASETDILPARLVAVYAFIGAFVFLVLGRELLRFIRTQLFRYGRGVRRVLVIGSSDTTADIVSSLANTKRSGYKIVAITGSKKAMPANVQCRHYASLDTALASLRYDRVDTIIQTDLYDSAERNQKILGTAQTHHIEYNFIPGEAEFYSGKNTTNIILGYPMITVYQTPLVGWGAIVKSITDLVIVSISILILSPIFILIMLLQKIFNPGPIFYVSKRLSRFSEPINLIKFRSMGAKFGKKDAAEEFREMGREDLAVEYEKNRKVENDPRITRFGKFLRNTSLDELPQLFNVLKRELSLVGPRPILPQEVNMSEGKAALLHSVKSGVTGLWQVSGRSELSFDERIELELFYAQNWTFWLDIKILFKTIAVVFRGKGAK